MLRILGPQLVDRVVDLLVPRRRSVEIVLFPGRFEGETIHSQRNTYLDSARCVLEVDYGLYTRQMKSDLKKGRAGI